MSNQNGLVQKPRFRDLISAEKYQKLINQTLGDPDRAKSFIAAVTSAVATNETLQSCNPSSVLSAALLGESLELSPSPQFGQYYMVPYEITIKDQNGKIIYEVDENGNYIMEYGRKKARKEKKAQFQIGYKGYIQLALRSGEYRKLNVLPIKKGELNRPFDALNEEIDVTLIDDEEGRAEAETIGYYAMFELQNGFRKALYWSYNKMLTHADVYSKAFKKDVYEKIKSGQVPEKDMWKYSSFWYKNFDEMACKTMLRQLISKWGPMSVKRDTQIITAIEKDMSIINEDGTHEYIDSAAPMVIEQADPVSEEKSESGTVDDLPFDVDMETGEVSMDDI